MVNADEFTRHLISFGLTEKEAQCYFYLLTYGPKTPAPLAKGVHTYPEDVHRTLKSLIDKGMVHPSLESPKIYAAVDIQTALDSAVKKRESELRDMAVRKQELQELSKRQQFGPEEEISTFTIIKDMKELTGISLARTASIKDEHVFILPALALSIGALAGITEAFKTLVARGVRVRGIIDVTGADASFPAELVQELLERGIDIRCLEDYRGLYFSVSDRKTCASIINVDVQRASLSAPTTVLWTEERTYARYLMSTFEMLWKQSVTAEERIKELQGRNSAHP